MTLNIGYLIPEFPGQTHIFFWREKAVLEAIGCHVDLVSTRRPPARSMVHSWAPEARRLSIYLSSPWSYLFGATVQLLRRGAWRRCARALGKSEGEKIRLLACVLMGAKLAYIGKMRGWQHLHVHSCGHSANIALFASLISGLPYSLTLHGPLSDYGENQKQKWSHAAFAFVITNDLREQVHRSLEGHLPPRIEIAPMGVDVAKFKRKAPYRPWKPGDICRIFSCGRLNPVKGHADLIEATRLVKRKGIPIRLDIAGEDDHGGAGYRQELEKIIAELEMSDSVRLLGAVSEATVIAWLEKAHVFSLASLHEPLGVAIMEAMALELPVVVASSPGVREMIDPNKDGLLVKPKSPAELAVSVQQILRDESLATRLGKAAREKIISTFQSTRSAELLVSAILDRSSMHDPQARI